MLRIVSRDSPVLCYMLLLTEFEENLFKLSPFLRPGNELGVVSTL